MRMKNLSAIYRSFQARILIIKLVNGEVTLLRPLWCSSRAIRGCWEERKKNKGGG